MTPSTRRTLVEQIVPPVAVTVGLGAIGAFSVWIQQPLLVPSLGSAIFLQTLTPNAPSARPWNTGVGQAIGAASGFLSVLIAGAESSTSFITNHRLLLARVAAAALAVFMTVVLQHLLKAVSAAGGATALVVAMGAETVTGAGAARLLAGIILVTAIGEASRRLILRLRGPASAPTA